jgi:hypothetical protein
VSPPRLLRLVCALAVWAFAPAAAWGGTAKVFPLSSVNELPAGLEGMPERLTNVIAKLVGAKVSDSSIKGAATAAGCTLNDSGCLDQIARANRVQEIVFGTVRIGDDMRVFVKLTRFIAGTERRERTFVLTAETPQALARQLARSAREMFELEEVEEPREEDPPKPRRPKEPEPREPEEDDGEEPKPRKGKEVGRLEETPPADPPVDEPARVRRGRVTAGTYFLISGGVMTLAIGTGFTIGALSLRDDLANARATTPDDTRRIAGIEQALRVRSTVGTVLLVGGGLAVAGGVVRALIQRRPIDDAPAVTIAPIEGGAALVLSGQLP